MQDTNDIRAGFVADDPAPVAPAALPDIPGGEPNLMPISALTSPVRIEFTLWPISVPTPDDEESIEIYCNGNKVGEKAWTQPLPESERFVNIPSTHFTQGRLQFHCVGHVYNQTVRYSEVLTLTVDKTSPSLGVGNGRLQFPELGDNDLTDYFLSTHDDRLQALVPDYVDAAPGDVIIHYWDSKLFENNEVDRWVLTRDDIGKPLQFSYPGDVIRERGDGVRYAQYVIEDRAGNASQVAQPLDLNVAAQPVPRVLPALETPSLGTLPSVDLDLRTFDKALDVSIPQAAVIHPGEDFELVWGEEGSFASWTQPGREGQRDFVVPMRNVVAMSGKVAQLYYRVISLGTTLKSAVREVKVMPIAVAHMPTPQANGQSGGDLDVGALTSAPAVTLEGWKHMGVDQRVSIQASGVSAGQPNYPVLTNYKLTTTDVAEGIGSRGNVTIPLSYLRQLEEDTPMDVTVKISYDDGATWPLLPNCGMLSLTIR
ncbi:hypothetical protein OO258_22665 [Pseudomonas sp. DCB_BI]|uniref:hypothetical protein n=1 Tax=Pseudomonas sp. DCB_BI TaxID=2993594 RepID=UPI00224B1C7E|nr:hypothetical protein [Pseudomonas sp. DCB_BI]MCX2891040.1 hypothetical protein [Pseudomonas sp. DCB_BI]